ncbi:Uncharacterised protein [Burkholderia pseudomallei]|nr:Uncharacterised protein [Burkholderia pseudomallei]
MSPALPKLVPAGRAAIDERDPAAAIPQVQRRRYADDAGAENDDVEIH